MEILSEHKMIDVLEILIYCYKDNRSTEIQIIYVILKESISISLLNIN